MNLAERGSDLLVREVSILRAVVGRVRAAYRLGLRLGLCCRIIWMRCGRGRSRDADFSTQWGLIKRGFSLGVGRGERVSASRRGKVERGVWQRRFWEHAIRDERDFAAHVDYVHFNPVKHGFVAHAGDWPYSTFRRAVRLGVYPADWGGRGEAVGDSGER